MGGRAFYFEKVRDRQVWDFALVNVASAMLMSDGGNGPTIDRMRIVVNGVAARPLRLAAVEELVRGRPAQRGDGRGGREPRHRGRAAAALTTATRFR